MTSARRYLTSPPLRSLLSRRTMSLLLGATAMNGCSKLRILSRIAYGERTAIHDLSPVVVPFFLQRVGETAEGRGVLRAFLTDEGPLSECQVSSVHFPQPRLVTFVSPDSCSSCGRAQVPPAEVLPLDSLMASAWRYMASASSSWPKCRGCLAPPIWSPAFATRRPRAGSTMRAAATRSQSRI